MNLCPSSTPPVPSSGAKAPRKLKLAPQRGGALLAVLWLSAALSAIAFSVANTVRTETERTGTASEGLRTYYLASGSIDRAILWMQRGLNGDPKYYRPPMPYLRFAYPSGVAVVEVIPETAKLNINTAPPEQLEMLVMACGVNQFQASQIVAAIIEWRTPGPSTPGFDFLNPDQTFRPRHASFDEIEDVLLVRGVTPDLFYGRFDRDRDGRLIPLGGLRDAITTYGGPSNQVDVNTAPPVLLAGLGLPPQGINAIVQRRSAKPFQSMQEVVELIGAGPWMSRLQVLNAATSPLWTLRSTARLRLADGRLSDLSRTVSATFAFLPQQQSQLEPNFHILRWRDEASTIAGSALPFIDPAQTGLAAPGSGPRAF